MGAMIIDYGSGNLHSARKALERAAFEAGLSMPVTITSRPEDIRQASHIVLPGVGAFADCRAGLRAIDGMEEALREAVAETGTPFLGICVGMQLLASRGYERGAHAGLDWIAGDVVELTPSDASLKVPHMGWNTLTPTASHPVLDNIALGSCGLHGYFVHSYHFIPRQPTDILAQTDYGDPIAAIIGRDNMIGTQFHPEKSQTLGLQLITNFLRWRGE